MTRNKPFNQFASLVEKSVRNYNNSCMSKTLHKAMIKRSKLNKFSKEKHFES